MWKFVIFYISLRFYVKSALLTQLEALNFDFNEFLHFLTAEIYQSNKIMRL